MNRTSLFTLLSFAMLAVDTDTALAKVVHFTASPNRVAQACGEVGGIGNGNSKGYGCVNMNCDGKGGTCAVYCDNGQHCTGSTPRPLGPHFTLNDLFNGHRPVRSATVTDIPLTPSLSTTESSPHGYGVPPVGPQHPPEHVPQGTFGPSQGSGN